MNGVLDILKQIGYTKITDYGKQVSMSPLYRESDNPKALTVNKETGEWYDFVECVGGGLDSLVEKTLGKPLDNDLRARIASGVTFSTDIVSEIELDHIKTFDKNLLLKLNKDNTFWERRGISKRIIEKFDGGITLNGRMANRYVFPIFNERKDLIGFSGRLLYNSEHVPKWKHLGAKSNWCYPTIQNGDKIFKSKTAILVESIGDMLNLNEAGIENVLVTFGVSINSKVIEFLLKADCNRVFIALNNDSFKVDLRKRNVGNISAEKTKQNLLNYFDKSQIFIALPSEKNDFGEMNVEEINVWKMKNLI
jgi:hypothetical protein